MELTQEQQDILNAFLKGKNIKINAFAGSGKTTTLKILSESVPDKKILVLVFNNAVARELETKFPANCYISTTHSFALKYIRSKFGNRVISSDKKLIYHIQKLFNLNTRQAYFVFRIVNFFYNSSEKSINLKFIIKFLKENDILFEIFKNINLNLERTIRIALKIFDLQKKGELPFTHSFYLKYFQVYLDEFLENINYDVVMLDEGQDTNMVTFDIFQRLGGQKVIVGDKHQSIYGWRGAYNVMDLCDFDEYYLSWSFRVNKDIAKKADFILKNYKNETKTFKAFFEDGGEPNGKECIITRTNTSIAKYVNYLPKGEKINFERNIDEIFKVPLDVEKVKKAYLSGDPSYYLRSVSEYIKSIFSECKNWDEFNRYVCDDLEDMELCSACVLANIASIYYIYRKAQKIRFTSKYYIATAHSIKGKEYEKVTIFNDFKDLFLSLKQLMKKRGLSAEEVYDLFYNHPHHPLIRKYVEEVNLMYVAITRVIKQLDNMSSAIDNLLAIGKDNFINHLKRL